MKAVLISDTHEMERKMAPLPKGDMLIHCGDFTGHGSIAAMSKFAQWMGSQDFKHKLIISGNHEKGMQHLKHDAAVEILTENGLTYLQDSSVEIDGLVFYGSPWSPFFFDWEWNLPRGEALAEKWKLIPSNVNVLITHSPPYGILDFVPRGYGYQEHAGCEELAKRVKELPNLRLNVFGHLHTCGGQTMEQDGVLFCNAAICTEDYRPTNLPIEVELTAEKAFALKRESDFIAPDPEGPQPRPSFKSKKENE